MFSGKLFYNVFVRATKWMCTRHYRTWEFDKSFHNMGWNIIFTMESIFP